MKVSLLIAGLVLSGCSAIPGYEAFKIGARGLTEQTVEERQGYNDLKADVVTAVLCDMSLGAYGRLPESDVKRGVALICGIDGESSVVSIETAMEVLTLFDRLRGEPLVPTRP